MKYKLCAAAEIEDPGSRAFTIDFTGKPLDVFVVHHNASFYAFVNSCPHTGANLEWLENQFLDQDKALIQCSTHDALFEIDSGLCIAGPCVSQSLQALLMQVDAGVLVLEIGAYFVNLNQKPG